MNWKEVTVRKCTTGYVVTVNKFDNSSTVYQPSSYTYSSRVEHAFEIFSNVKDYLDMMVFDSEEENK